ncbi:NAD(P)-binding protein, partial [Gemmatimonadota bacterium]
MLLRPESKEIDRRARLHAPPVEDLSQPPRDRIRNFDEVLLPWTGDMVTQEASRCLHCPGRPCVTACPLGSDIPLALWLAEHGDMDGAAGVFFGTNNFTEVCGRLCRQSEQCEGACPHIKEGLPPVAIGRIETYLADRLSEKPRRAVGSTGAGDSAGTGRKVAVVGAGPAGLTVAELLAEPGHSVTVFDQWADGGGVLRYRIPRFKLDHGLVRERLKRLRGMGVEFVFNTRIGDGLGIDTLQGGPFDAVFLGTGSWIERESG